MKKVIGNEAALSDWLEAERQMYERHVAPQPQGSVTTDQFAVLKGIAERTAANQLYRMYKAAIATREKWGRFYVYWPKGKK